MILLNMEVPNIGGLKKEMKRPSEKKKKGGGWMNDRLLLRWFWFGIKNRCQVFIKGGKKENATQQGDISCLCALSEVPLCSHYGYEGKNSHNTIPVNKL